MRETMQETFYSWVRLLLIGTVCMQLVLQFIVQKEYRYYIQMFLSMVFLLTVCRPLLSVTGLKQQMEKTVEDILAEQEYTELVRGKAFYLNQEDTLLKEAMQQKLTEDTDRLLQEYQLSLVRCDSQVKVEKNSAEIEKISLEVTDGEGNVRLSSDEKTNLGETIRERLADRYEMDRNDIAVAFGS